MPIRFILLIFLTLSMLRGFETTNLQLLYSNGFNGDAFIYDTVDGKKSTLTFEHYRTFTLGDFYMFVDALEGEKFDGVKSELYSEISPRFSLSKLSTKSLSLGPFKDIFIATQINLGSDYRAYLGGLGSDISLAWFDFFSMNLYYKEESIDRENCFQLSLAYQSKPLYNTHFEGFIDITSRDINTQNQLLYNLSNLLKGQEQIYLGTEWLYYDYSYRGERASTNVLQAMMKYKF